MAYFFGIHYIWQAIFLKLALIRTPDPIADLSLSILYIRNGRSFYIVNRRTVVMGGEKCPTLCKKRKKIVQEWRLGNMSGGNV